MEVKTDLKFFLRSSRVDVHHRSVRRDEGGDDHDVLLAVRPLRAGHAFLSHPPADPRDDRGRGLLVSSPQWVSDEMSALLHLWLYLQDRSRWCWSSPQWGLWGCPGPSPRRDLSDISSVCPPNILPCLEISSTALYPPQWWVCCLLLAASSHITCNISSQSLIK